MPAMLWPPSRRTRGSFSSVPSLLRNACEKMTELAATGKVGLGEEGLILVHLHRSAKAFFKAANGIEQGSAHHEIRRTWRPGSTERIDGRDRLPALKDKIVDGSRRQQLVEAALPTSPFQLRARS